MSVNLNCAVGSCMAADLGPKPTGWDDTSDMCRGCEVLEACASLLVVKTGEDGVLNTCFVEGADVGGLSISSMLRTGAWEPGLVLTGSSGMARFC